MLDALRGKELGERLLFERLAFALLLLHGGDVDHVLGDARLAGRDFVALLQDVLDRLHRVAEAATAISNVGFKVGDLGDTMKRAEEVLQKRYETSEGKARVAKDMVDMDTVTEKENERKALEQVALAEFLASQGIQSTPEAGQTTPVASKEIGPER